jgi:hypothetical protein
MFRRTFLKITALTGLGFHLPWGKSTEASRHPDLSGESVQDLINQLRQIECDYVHTRPVIPHILAHIRIKLLLAGMICRFEEQDGKERFCIVMPYTFELMTFSLRSLDHPDMKEVLEAGFGPALKDYKNIPHARLIF